MSKFQFESPNYTMTPNDLFDHLLKEIDDVSELKVTLMAVRMTIGYHKDAAELSIEYLHQSTGLAKNSVRRGLALAIRRGTIRVVKKSTNRTGGIYALNVRVSATDTLEVQPVTPLKKVKKVHTHAPVEIDAERASMPTPRETAWNELATVFPMTNGVSWQKFDEAWRTFPDLRRHAYAIERARKANPAKFTFYLEDFYGYDPDKPKTWGAEKATQPRAPAKAPARGVSWDQMRNYE